MFLFSFFSAFLLCVFNFSSFVCFLFVFFLGGGVGWGWVGDCFFVVVLISSKFFFFFLLAISAAQIPFVLNFVFISYSCTQKLCQLDFFISFIILVMYFFPQKGGGGD